jgi:glycosyltransferase involved in cell wall biosynthesis
MAGKAFTPEMKAYARDTGLENEIISIEGCDSEQLRALYSAAELLLFPSILEGFGWPIIEAQACGCRVVTTHRAPMTEVGGDAALYVDAKTETNVARQTALLLNQSPAAREELQRRGIVNAARFSTEAMIDKYIVIYNELLGTSMTSQDANPTRSAIG